MASLIAVDALSLLLSLATTPAASPSAAEPAVFETTVAPLLGEDLAKACSYELTLADTDRPVKAVWVIFERSRETLGFYQDPTVRAFARRHDLALLFPRHCPSKSETGGDMNVDPNQGIGRALFTALTQLAPQSGHPELQRTGLIVLGFSGTGALAARLAAFAPDRMLAVVATNPGHFEPFGMNTIRLSKQAATVPHLIVVGSADAVSGTERPYAYFRRHFVRGARWTFVVQNGAPHCCIMNAKTLVLAWLEAVIDGAPRHSAARYGFLRTHPTRATDCPGQTAPVRQSWCRGSTDAWGGGNWSVADATVATGVHAHPDRLPAGWLPDPAFARQWQAFVTQSEHPVTLPP